ncbi:MAG: hypothetical protein HUJ53_11295, partial [Holdemanella sp.]|nr:hypothetical protein [Holdemanella sp.]
MKRFLMIIMAFLLVYSNTIGIYAKEETQDEPKIYTFEEYVPNPIYPDEPAILMASDDDDGRLMESECTYEDVESAGAFLREGLKSFSDTIIVYYRFYYPDFDEGDAWFVREITNNIFAEAIKHTGNPVEGDYMRWTYRSRYQRLYIEDDNGGSPFYDMKIRFEIRYNLTYEQAQEETQAVNALLSELDVYNASDYEKVYAIYDWICKHITYDHANDDGYLLKYTSYAGIVNRTCVCQGYALLFYRLALSLGVDSRLIAGYAGGGGHGWNIVKMGNNYYNLDSTWDAGKKAYSYFLLDEQSFANHTRWDEYKTTDFMSAYPMGGTRYKVLSSLTIDQDDIECLLFSQGDLSYTAQYIDTTLPTMIYWESGNNKAVTVDNNGHYRTLKPGRTSIRIKCIDGSSDTITLNVSEQSCEDGLHFVDGDLYYYENGYPVLGWKEIDNDIYYFDDQKKAVNGWYSLENGDYYFIDYKMVTGLMEIDGKLYYFEEDGKKHTGWAHIDGYDYYFNAQGEAVEGWYDNFFFIDHKKAIGLVLLEGYLYDFGSDGILKNGWSTYDGDIYYFDDNCQAVNGWMLLDDKMYYFDEYKMVTGWVT